MSSSEDEKKLITQIFLSSLCVTLSFLFIVGHQNTHFPKVINKAAKNGLTKLVNKPFLCRDVYRVNNSLLMTPIAMETGRYRSTFEGTKVKCYSRPRSWH